MAEQTNRIGRRIAEAREAAKLTQAELAAKIPGKSDGTQMSKWERGVHRPGDDTLEHIARVLRKDVSWFIIPDAEEEPETPDLFPEPKLELANGSETKAQLDRIERKLDEILKRLDAPPAMAPDGADDDLSEALPDLEPTEPDESTTQEAEDESESDQEEAG